MRKRIHVYFSGRVQGVGFRFLTENMAQDLGVLGWVRNLGDGRVEIMAEAEEEVLEEFLSRIRQDFSQYIKDVKTEWLKTDKEFKGFEVKF